uniref:Uncharacterized protein n=1 Tax=Sphenodon punctatus TaxID=8508 RepID=A0A8D0GK38_SPHPU
MVPSPVPYPPCTSLSPPPVPPASNAVPSLAPPSWSPAATAPLFSLANALSLAVMSMAHSLLPAVTPAPTQARVPHPTPIMHPPALYPPSRGPAHFVYPEVTPPVESVPLVNGLWAGPTASPNCPPSPSTPVAAAGRPEIGLVPPSSPHVGPQLIVSESQVGESPRARLSPINEESKPQILGRFQVTPTRDLTENPLGSMAPDSTSASETDMEDSGSPGGTPVQEAEEGTTPVGEGEGDIELPPTPTVWMNYLRGASYLSSDDSDSPEDEDVWEELQQLRQKHLSEVQMLQAQQKQEIEELYSRMGKVPPPGIVSPAAILSQRQRRLSKGSFNPTPRRNSLQPPGIMRRNSLSSGSSTGSQEQRPNKGVTFAGDVSRM